MSSNLTPTATLRPGDGMVVASYKIIMIINPLLQNSPWRKALYEMGQSRTSTLVARILPYLETQTSILDIGCGPCLVAEQLVWRGFDVTAVDVDHNSVTREVVPQLYDGRRLPFRNNSFDVALILSVLHYTPDPVLLIKEASRVANRLLILEDVYTSDPHRIATYLLDSLFNLEFKDHPHSNLSTEGWQRLFEKEGLKVLAMDVQPYAGVLKHALFCLEK